MTICLTYPNEYPAYHVLIELKSKTIGQKLLDGLVKVSEVSSKDASYKCEQTLSLYLFRAGDGEKV